MFDYKQRLDLTALEPIKWTFQSICTWHRLECYKCEDSEQTILEFLYGEIEFTVSKDQLHTIY